MSLASRGAEFFRFCIVGGLTFLVDYGLLFLLLIAVQLPWERWCSGLAEKWMKNRGGQAALCLGYVLLFGLCVAYLVDASFNPFLYFRF